MPQSINPNDLGRAGLPDAAVSCLSFTLCRTLIEVDEPPRGYLPADTLSSRSARRHPIYRHPCAARVGRADGRPARIDRLIAVTDAASDDKRGPYRGIHTNRGENMNRKTKSVYIIAVISAWVLTADVGCDTNPIGNNNNNDNTNGAVATNISVHVQAAIKAGSDLVVYGTGGATGVDYIRPSQGDAAGRGIPQGDTYDSRNFAVAGRNVFLTDNSFQLTVFNVDTQSSTTIPANQIRLNSLPAGQYDVGRIHADGNLCVAICDQTQVTDGHMLKVVDVTSGTPTVVALTQSPVATAGEIQQAVVHGDTRQVVVSAGGNFYLFDIDSPTDLPLLMAGAIDGVANMPIAFDGQRVFYHDGANMPNAVVFDIAANENVTMNPNRAAGLFTLRNGTFGYFLADNSIGGQLRSALGAFGSGPIAGTTVTTATTGALISSGSTNNGGIGYGQTIAVTPNGSRWFIAGRESISAGEFLQTSTGGTFTIVPDPNGTNALGCPASDVDCSNNTVAFKYGTANTTFVAYMRLN